MAVSSEKGNVAGSLAMRFGEREPEVSFVMIASKLQSAAVKQFWPFWLAKTARSWVIRNIFGGSINYAPLADFNLLRQAYEQSVKQGIPARVGNIVSVDRFYDDEIDNDKLTQYGIMAVEMETAGLYTLAAKYGAQALGLFTVSDHLLTGEACTPEERQTSFDDMIHIALETAVQE